MLASCINRSLSLFSHDERPIDRSPLSYAQTILLSLGVASLSTGTLGVYKITIFSLLSPQLVTLSFSVSMIALILIMAASRSDLEREHIEGIKKCPLNYAQKLFTGLGISNLFFFSLSYRKVALFAVVPQYIVRTSLVAGCIFLLLALLARKKDLVAEEENQDTINDQVVPRARPVPVHPNDFPDPRGPFLNQPPIDAAAVTIPLSVSQPGTLDVSTQVPSAVNAGPDLRIETARRVNREGEPSPDPSVKASKAFVATHASAAAAGAGAGAAREVTPGEPDQGSQDGSPGASRRTLADSWDNIRAEDAE